MTKRRIAEISIRVPTLLDAPYQTINHSFSKDFIGEYTITSGALVVDLFDIEGEPVRADAYKDWISFDVHYVNHDV